MSKTQGAGLNVRHVGFPARTDGPATTILDDVPVMDAITWILVYAMHLTTVEWHDGSETIRGAIKKSVTAWTKSTGQDAPFFNPVWAVVEDAWDDEVCHWYEGMADLTLKDFDEAADHERPLVLRCAFNRHTGIHETFRFV